MQKIDNKKGQVGIFVLIAIVLVASIAGYLIFRGSLSIDNVPENLRAVYNAYDQCITQETLDALNLAGSQGGRLEVGDYQAGSDYAPFASHLNFFGFPVPYWYYISGNGVVRQNMPSLQDSEEELENYLAERIANCDFSNFQDQGYEVELEQPTVNVNVQDREVEVEVNADLSVSYLDNSAVVNTRILSVNSMYGTLFKDAQEIYEKQMNDAFLENYSIDVLRLYAPVDGVLIQCNPEIWQSREVVEGIQQGLEANLNSLRFESSKPNTREGYFVNQYNGESEVRVLYSQTWPFKAEIYGADGEVMIAEPSGNQQGFGILGFCYVPYHYVYDLSFPVLFQVTSGNELFQFPVAVVIDKNVPRKAEQVEGFTSELEVDICNSANQPLEVKTYSVNLEPVDATLTYQCFDQRCRLGASVDGTWSGLVPSCVNGFLEVQAEGYQKKRELLSTNVESQFEVILDREYEVDLKILVDNQALEGNALITFTGQTVKSALIPESSSIKLAEGLYNISVQVYSNSSLTIPGSTRQECTNTPKSGFFGFFGGTEETCVTINLPETKVDYALQGGGTAREVYLFPGQLESGVITINVPGLSKPNTLAELQNNYASFDVLTAEVLQ